MPRTQETRGCIDKKPWPSKKAAKQAVRRSQAEYGGHFEAYLCPKCGQWHVGHMAGTKERAGGVALDEVIRRINRTTDIGYLDRRIEETLGQIREVRIQLQYPGRDDLFDYQCWKERAWAALRLKYREFHALRARRKELAAVLCPMCRERLATDSVPAAPSSAAGSRA